MTILFVKTKSNIYKYSKPFEEKIKFINYLYNKDFILNYLHQGLWAEIKERKSLAIKQGYKFTKKQLDKWGMKYDELLFGKPSFDIYIDDKNLNFKDNWPRLLKKKLKIKN